MLRVSIPLHHRDVSACVPWIRTVSCSSRVHVNHSRRFRNLHASHIPQGSRPSIREQIRNDIDNKKQHDRHASPQQTKTNDSSSDRWELTVGIEIHAQLNTERKLFSSARTSLDDEPNSHVSVFDLAFPGSQPIFQKATLVPALRAALALKCDIQPRSQFDRKHYFYHDQPSGYQITQYYEPFAKNGYITLSDQEGIAPEDGEYVRIGIKQIQLEQDTAKTIMQSSSTTLLDFNRASHPLIEIITLPQIHHPRTAAACVKKIHAVLQAVNAVTTGMEMGGLRADVNVSVQPKSLADGKLECHSYAGITGLGQRTEIKNLSSFKAVEDAIVAERNRQISLIESGGMVRGETRGWSLGSTGTKKLRGKEGEVDYRYLPDPDLSPLIIAPDLIRHLSDSLPELPDHSIEELVEDQGLTMKDAKTLVSLDGGERLDYYDEIVNQIKYSTDEMRRATFDGASSGRGRNPSTGYLRQCGKTAANWVLHELGGLLTTEGIPFSENPVSAKAMAAIVLNCQEGRITHTIAKDLLAKTFNGDSRDINTIIVEENLGFESLPRKKYEKMAQKVIREKPEVVHEILDKGRHKKIQWFVGQMMSRSRGKMEPRKAEAMLKEILGIDGGEVKEIEGRGGKKGKEKNPSRAKGESE